MDAEAELVRRAASGDASAFERLVEPELPRLYTLAARVTGSADDGADAVQDGLLRAWLALPRFRGRSRFSTWLYRICLNAALDHAGGRPRTVPLERAPEPVAASDPALAGELQHALGALELDRRVAVVLCDLLGCAYAEAAAILGVPEGTVKSRVFRGRRALARTLGTGEPLPKSNET